MVAFFIVMVVAVTLGLVLYELVHELRVTKAAGRKSKLQKSAGREHDVHWRAGTR